jgi:hypothetical protein
MKAYAKILAALTIALAPVAMASMTPASAQPRGEGHHGQGRGGENRGGENRGGGRSEPRGESRRDYRGGGNGGGYRGPVYSGRPGYAYPPPAYVYPQAPPAYAPPPPYGYAASPPAYAPNSLGAGWGQQQDQARRGVRQGGLMPLGQVMQNIGRSTPGRLLDAGLEPGPDGRPAYRVRWAAAGGRRIDFIVDAATGAIIGRSGY